MGLNEQFDGRKNVSSSHLSSLECKTALYVMQFANIGDRTPPLPNATNNDSSFKLLGYLVTDI